MKLKANLHFHSKEDPCDALTYDLYEGIDHAAKLGFDVLASTCHTKNIVTEDHITYAASKGLLLIPGIEANIFENGKNRVNHVVILNCDASANDIHTFDDLAAYRVAHPEIFVLAAHPYLYGNISLSHRLEKHIDLFDAIEHTWFYTRWFDRNPRGERTAQRSGKPFIATSDTHFFAFMDKVYTTVDATEKTPAAFFTAIRGFRFANTTSPRSLFDVFVTFASHTIVSRIRRYRRKTTFVAPELPSLTPAQPAYIPINADEPDHEQH